jgi:hypothetical protein
MAEQSVTVVYGPDKPALQWALLYPERGQSVAFKTHDEIVEAQIDEMDEIGNGFSFGLKGKFCSGSLQGQPFHGTYSVESRTGSLTLDN